MSRQIPPVSRQVSKTLIWPAQFSYSQESQTPTVKEMIDKLTEVRIEPHWIVTKGLCASNRNAMRIVWWATPNR
jgi:hypothetical protein